MGKFRRLIPVSSIILGKPPGRIIAVPLGLYSAIYLSQYARPKVRNYFKPILEILAGIPTVVYGFFAALSVGPFIRSTGESLGLTVSTESALAAGLVMGIMITLMYRHYQMML